jgi:hypothetical protein
VIQSMIRRVLLTGLRRVFPAWRGRLARSFLQTFDKPAWSEVCKKWALLTHVVRTACRPDLSEGGGGRRMWGPTNPRRVLARAALVAATILAPVAARAETVSGDRIVIGEERITKATPSIASCEGGRGGSIRDTCRWTARKHQILRAASRTILSSRCTLITGVRSDALALRLARQRVEQPRRRHSRTQTVQRLAGPLDGISEQVFGSREQARRRRSR